MVRMLARLVIWMRIVTRFDRTPIQVPGRMSEQRQHHREPDEERDRADHQERGDNQSPQRHRQRIRRHHAKRGLHRVHRADIAVEQQRE